MIERIRGVSEEETLRYKEWIYRDPVGYPWVTRLCEILVLCALLQEVIALYKGRWVWGAIDALCVLINAWSAQVNTLPLSQRARIFGFLKRRFRPTA